MTLDTQGLLAPQIPHATKLFNTLLNNNIAVDTSETGTGKTYSACAIAASLAKTTVVVCPKSVIPKWKNLLEQYGIKKSIVINYELLCRGNTKWLEYSDKIYTHKWETCKVKFPKDCFVILDESHKCKGQNSLNAGLLIALKNQKYSVMLLSATQACSPLDMKAFGYATDLHKLQDFKSFCLDYGAEIDNRFGALKFDAEDKKAQAKMKLCHRELFDIKQYASRLSRNEFGNLFPDNHVVAEAFDMGDNTKKINDVYDKMEYEISKLEEHSADYSSHIFAIMMKARRHAELLKVPTIVEMAEQLFDENNSVALFLNFNDTIDAIVSRLNKNLLKQIAFVRGGQKWKERYQHISEFQSDKRRIMLANIKAGGVSIDLHDLNGNHPRCSIVSPNFSAIELIQALGRIHRQGGLTKCYQQIMFAAGTIEERACQRVQMRLNNLSCLNDGDLMDGFNYFKF